MQKKKPYSKKILPTICLLTVILVLVGSVGSAGAIDYKTYYPSGYDIKNGTYSSGSVTTSLRSVDSDYFAVTSSPSATATSTNNPSAYNLFGGTKYVSGTTGDLSSNDNVHMIYGGYPSVTSAQNLYAHGEVTTVGGNSYYLQKPESPDLAGTDLSTSMAATGRQLIGKFVYPLTGIDSLPSSTLIASYRAWRDPDPSIAYDSVGSGNNGDGAANITWSHVVGSGSNRFMIIGVSIKTETVSVLSVTVGNQSATFLRTDTRVGEVKGEIWYLINPSPGSKTVKIVLSGLSKACGGSVSYTGVDQSSPIDNHQAVLYGGTRPSIFLTTTTATDWIFSNLAISGTATVTQHESGQVHRFYQVGTGGGGSTRAGIDGDDKLTIAPGSQVLSWNTSFWIEAVVQAVAFKPASPPIGHVDVDIAIMKSDGTVRTMIAINVANSVDLTPTPTTLTAAYSWATYNLLNHTDYLEIDYYANVVSATPGVSAYLRIDDNALPTSDQTRISNIMLPSEYTAEVELTGTGNTCLWTSLQWTVDSAWTADSVTVTLQLYNYTLGEYPTIGNGVVSFTSNATANTDETTTQTITGDPSHFKDAGGNWRIRIRGIKTTDNQFQLKIDLAELRTTYYSEYTVSTEFQFSSMIAKLPTQLNFTLASDYDVTGVSVIIQVWNYSASTYALSGQSCFRYTSLGANETKVVTITMNPQPYTANGSARIRVTGVLSTTTQYQQRINQVRLDYGVDSLGSFNPFDWLTMVLYVLPVPLALFFLWFLGFRRRKKNKGVISKKADTFSGQFGMTHQQMLGKKMLLEIDPTSSYREALSGFASEAVKADEPFFILTNKNSALHSAFSETPNVNLLLLTSKTHYPKPVNNRETLLPSSDLSVILNSCSEIQKTGQTTVNLLFDNISDLILRCEFEKTYKFTRLLLEAISSPKTTAVFLFVPTAHDQEILSSIRSLFQNRLGYTKDGPEV